MSPSFLFAVIWIGWIASWIGAALWSGRTVKRDATWELWVYRVAITLGAILLFYSSYRFELLTEIWHVGDGIAYALAGLTLAGILFAWWARLHLGRLWSSAITRKEDHELVNSGPYAVVRHPIYSGLIVAILATAAAQATVPAMIGATVVVLGLWLKARAEEHFLMQEISDYRAYRRRVPMLVPLLWFGRLR